MNANELCYATNTHQVSGFCVDDLSLSDNLRAILEEYIGQKPHSLSLDVYFMCHLLHKLIDHSSSKKMCLHLVLCFLCSPCSIIVYIWHFD